MSDKSPTVLFSFLEDLGKALGVETVDVSPIFKLPVCTGEGADFSAFKKHYLLDQPSWGVDALPADLVVHLGLARAPKTCASRTMSKQQQG